MQILVWLGLIAGFILLIKGADIFVDASSNIAKKFNIPSIIIGLTIVTFGTSAPEFVISMSATFSGASGITVGNIVGSNTFNTLLVIGFCAIIRPIYVKFSDIKRDYLCGMGSAALVFILMLIFTTQIPRIAAGLMLVIFIVYLTFVLRGARHKIAAQPAQGNTNIPLAKNICIALLGASIILAGGQLTVSCALHIATQLGISERMVGLTILAIGTSLPELITSIVACKKGESDIAIGNVVGSNVFNILFVIGSSGLVAPLVVSPELTSDFSFLLIGSVALLIFICLCKRVSRAAGFVLVLSYAAYMLFIA